jgi:imidazolonepropionase-like amidohydrolase
MLDTRAGQVIDRGYILVEGERIQEMGEGDPVTRGDPEVLDLRGRFLMPGLVNAHVHLVWDGSADPDARIRGLSPTCVAMVVAAQARRHLVAGITTVRDVGSLMDTVLSLRWAVNEGLWPGPNIITSGAPLTMTGGHMHPVVAWEVDGEQDILKAVRSLIKAGVDLIKVMATGGVYTPGEEPGSAQMTAGEMSVAVREAHRKGIPVAAHAEGLQGIKEALEAGVDAIEHGNYAGEEALKTMRERGVFLVPTASWFLRASREDAVELGIPGYVREKVQEVVDAQRQSLPEAIRKGVRIAVGTDAGAPLHPPENYHMEVTALREMGMDPMESLRAATLVGAMVCNREDIGRLEPGCLADVLAIDGNPLERPGDLLRVHTVMKSGRLVGGDSW